MARENDTDKHDTDENDAGEPKGGRPGPKDQGREGGMATREIAPELTDPDEPREE
ncbi:hypothetical protein IU486_22900 [Streptomyces gardneri]|uniref:hypothetical protein n=1 Tax=Nocardia TaxID=1817 RepID=UPI001894942A|nr:MULTISPECIES: hypothetical protein [Nocardia]MBF6167586.1 hypothetical protein [Streptomyces gardneri]MBF6206361.1 hypothetical protein [Streptomyces gardneri]UAK30348.1 hypothetical protein K8O92_20715 [Nocardia asteroides]